MTTMNFMLIMATLAGLVSTWWLRPYWLNGLPLAVAGIALLQLVVDGYQANLLSVYMVVVCLFFVAVRRFFGLKPTANQPRRGTGLYLAILGRGLGLLALFLAVRATLFFSLPSADFSQMTWEVANA